MPTSSAGALLVAVDRVSGRVPTGQSQDEAARADERRRVARELHDTTSQLLVVLQLNIGELRRTGLPEGRPILDELEKTIAEIRAQIHVLSFNSLEG